MTTIAYRDGVMASDSAVTWNETTVFNVRKVWKRPDGWLMGCAGTLRDVGILKDWFVGKFVEAETPATKGFGLLADPKGGIHFLERGVVTKVQGKYAATGSGMEIALGAMDAGASAEEAVRIASKRDAATQLPLQRVKLG